MYGRPAGPCAIRRAGTRQIAEVHTVLRSFVLFVSRVMRAGGEFLCCRFSGVRDVPDSETEPSCGKGGINRLVWSTTDTHETGIAMTEKKTAFDKLMEQRQIAWRNAPTNKINSGEGWQNGLQRPWILESDNWEQSLWPGIRSGASDSLLEYLAKAKIQPHAGKHNLKSSWVHCANRYFPFGQSDDGRALLAGFLALHVDARIEKADAVRISKANKSARAKADRFTWCVL